MTYLIKTKFEITACEACPCFDSEWGVCNLTGSDTYAIEICYWEEKLPDCPLETVEVIE